MTTYCFGDIIFFDKKHHQIKSINSELNDARWICFRFVFFAELVNECELDFVAVTEEEEIAKLMPIIREPKNWHYMYYKTSILKNVIWEKVNDDSFID